MSAHLLLATVLIALMSAPETQAAARPDEDAISILHRMPARYAPVRDYSAVFLMQERIRGELLPLETIGIKFATPFRLYLRWANGPNRGRQVLYVEGENDNLLLDREPGLLGLATFRLDPRGFLAMRGRRHPVTEIGIGKLVEHALALLERQPVILDLGDDTATGRPVRRLELRSPDATGDEPHHVRLGIDSELGLPVEVERFDADGNLLELYRYTGLRLNVGLDPWTFDSRNPAYGF